MKEKQCKKALGDLYRSTIFGSIFLGDKSFVSGIVSLFTKKLEEQTVFFKKKLFNYFLFPNCNYKANS